MSVRINTLSEDEIRSIGDAFADYEYADSEWGMSFLGKGKQAVSDYICAYVRMAIRERVLYKRIRSVVRDREVLEIATGPGVIGFQQSFIYRRS